MTNFACDKFKTFGHNSYSKTFKHGKLETSLRSMYKYVYIYKPLAYN